MAIFNTRSRISAGRGFTVLALMSAAIMGGACGVYQAGVRTGHASATALAPIDPSTVRLFGGEAPGLIGTEVGFVVGVSDVDEEWLAVHRVRSAAAALGADAVVDLRFDVLQSTELVARGRAVKIAHAPAMAGGAP